MCLPLVYDQNPSICKFFQPLPRECRREKEGLSQEQDLFIKTAPCVRGNEKPYATSHCTHAKGQDYTFYGSFNLAFLDMCGFHMFIKSNIPVAGLLCLNVWVFIEFMCEGN